MNLINARIDERLVHGIVSTYWLPSLKADRALCIDDEAANNPVVKSALRMATPKNIYLSAITLEKALDNIKNDRYGTERVMLIVKKPETVLALVEAGVAIDKLTIGNMGHIGKAADAVDINNNASVTPAEKRVFDALVERGTKLVFQFLPGDAEVDFSELLRAQFPAA